MMTNEIIRYLSEQGAQLYVVNGNLKVNAPSGIITDELKRLLSENKQQIIKKLSYRDYDCQSITPHKTTENAALSFAQQRLWFINQLSHGSNTNYNMVAAYRIFGNLNIKSLVDAFQEIIKRHAILRTVFVKKRGRAEQIVHDTLPIEIPITDLNNTTLSSCLSSQYSHVFDLAKGPLLNVSIIQESQHKHIMIINTHHIISDGWSVNIMMDEISALYNAFSQAKPSPLPPLPFQYHDFTRWQYKWLESPIFQQQLDYWKKQLKGIPGLLQLPTDQARQAQQHYCGRYVTFSLSAPLATRLEQLSVAHNCTLFMTLLAAFQLLLARLSGQRDICVGTPSANRQSPDLEKLIGLFVNILVIRTQISDQMSFSDLLSITNENVVSAFSNQDIPFERVVEALNPTRSQSHNPVYQVTFSLQNDLLDNFKLDNCDVIEIQSEGDTTLFDLSMRLKKQKGKISGHIQYDSDLFHNDSIQQMVDTYQNILEQATQFYQSPLKDLTGLSRTDCQKLLIDWQGSSSNNTNSRTNPLFPHQWLEKHAINQPCAIAAICGGSRINNKALNEKANRIAHYLQSLGVGPDTIVGICISNSIDLLAGLIAISKAGGAYLPIDTEYPPQRVQLMVKNSGCLVILTQESLQSVLFKNTNVATVCIDTGWSQISSYSKKNVLLGIKPSNIAYVNYTSGSTGSPKGVMITHEAFINHLTWMQYNFQINENDTLMLNTPLVFDVASWQWTLPLLCSAQLIIPPTDTHRDPEKLLTLIHRYRVSILHVVPTVLNHLVNLEKRQKLASIRYLLCGGETLSTALYNAFKSNKYSSTVLCNLYGPTETTIDSTCCIVSSPPRAKSIPIGKPIDNTKIYLLDNDLCLVPVGAVGKIYIAGMGLARGYINKPRLTAESFLPNPFSNAPGSRLYKTGDTARYLAKGEIEFLGRIDNQIKLRGRRIELFEIENTLLIHPAIIEAAVVKHQDKKSNSIQQLLAYVVCREKVTLAPSDIQAFLRTHLPEYMLPTRLLFLDKLPLTATGKVNRFYLSTANLPAIVECSSSPEQLSKTEEELINIWNEVINSDAESKSETKTSTAPRKIGKQSNFFDLGGHSISATMALNRIQYTFNCPLKLSDFFSSPTIEQLARIIDSAETNNRDLTDTISTYVNSSLVNSSLTNSTDGNNVITDSHGNVVPISLSQHRFWPSDNQVKQGKIIPIVFKLEGDLKVSLLRKAMQHLVQRHDSLRTVFKTINNAPYQIQLPTVELPFFVMDITTEDLPNHLHALTNTKFDLTAAPLFKTMLLRISPQEHILCMCFHHIIIDGWSLNILTQEMSILYTGFLNNTPISLPPLLMSYRNYCFDQHRQAESGEFITDTRYWENQLAKANTTKTVRIRPKYKQQYTNNDIQQHKNSMNNQGFNLDPALSQQLHQYGSGKNITAFTLLIAVFSITLLQRYGGKSVNILFDSANRKEQTQHNMVGSFSNTLILTVQHESSLTCDEFFLKTQQNILDATEHQSISFNDLININNSGGLKTDNPDGAIAFSFQNESDKSLTLQNVDSTRIPIKCYANDVQLAMLIIQSGDRLSAEVVYDNAYFDASSAKNLAIDYQTQLSRVVSSTNVLLNDFALTPI